MSDNTEFLKTEMLVHNLLEELNKLKSAVDQIEDTKNSAKTIRESAENIVRATTELLTIGKTILNRLDEVRLKEKLDEIEKLGKDSVNSAKTIQESADNIVRATTELLTTGKTILNRVDEVRFKERFDEVEKLGKDSVNSAKTIQESADNIVRATTELLTIGKTILNRLDEVRLKERLDEIEKLGKNSVESNMTMLIRMNKLEKHNIYFSIGIIGLLVLQAATLVFLYLN